MRQVPRKTAAPRLNIGDLLVKKNHHQKISMLTCYDYPSARMIAETELDCVLVGDSVAMAVHGFESTVMATLDMMILHTKAVARGLGGQLLITDLPFLCHRVSLEDTMNNVRQLVHAGAQAIKIEGGDAHTCETIAFLVNADVPIIGHIGLTPQSILKLGGYYIQGRDAAKAEALLEQALCLERAGCSAIVLECVPEKLAKTITDALTIPVIGIGAGACTDGQVLVWHDMLGLHDFTPRFVKQFVQGNALILEGIHQYIAHVRNIEFPALEHSF
jgi:3-methyl-2-oxobutanoate hydroxymethyltransferase